MISDREDLINFRILGLYHKTTHKGSRKKTENWRLETGKG
jgi:hypothetical protein